MNRRGFLRLIGLGAPAVAIAPFVPLPEFASGGSDLVEKHDTVVYWDNAAQEIKLRAREQV